MRPSLMLLFLLAFTVFVVGCQLQPTRVKDSKTNNSLDWVIDSDKAVKVTENTIFVDARGAFQSQLLRLPRSVTLSWSDLSDATKKTLAPQGEVIERLALKGLAPTQDIVVVVQGPVTAESASVIEGAQIAWALLYFGFESIRLADVEAFRKFLTNSDVEPLPNQKPWKPGVRSSLLASEPMFQQAIKRKLTGQSVFIFDVRSPGEYMQKRSFGGPYKTPNIEAMNIEWIEFFTPQGLPNFEMIAKLAAIGVTEKSEIFVISNYGIRSAAVTYALGLWDLRR